MKLLLSAMLLPIIIILLLFLISKKKINSKNKMNPFECGFEAFSKGRIPFSLRFFKITLIFLIFDIEIIMMLPMPIMINSNTPFLMTTLILITIIMLGLLYEWSLGTLNWIK